MKRFFALTAPLMICAALMIPAKGQTPADNDRAKSLLADALKAKNPDIRKEAVKALRLVAGSGPFGTRLEALLNDKDVQVRLAAIEALAELKNGPALKAALNDKVAEVRFAAATALFKLNDPAGRAFLMGVLTGDEKISSGMIESHLRDAKRTMETPNVLMMLAVKQGIDMAPVPYIGMGFSVAQEALAHRGVSGRAATALLLGKGNDPEVIAALRETVTDKDAQVRAAAVQALALADDTGSATLFAGIFKDKNQGVRLRAAAGYLRLDSAAAVRISETEEE
jgi:HEAT repeat protein